MKIHEKYQYFMKKMYDCPKDRLNYNHCLLNGNYIYLQMLSLYMASYEFIHDMYHLLKTDEV